MRRYSRGSTRFLILAAALTCCACATTTQRNTAAEDQSAKPVTGDVQSATVESAQLATPLDMRFDHVVFKQLETTDQIRRDYPEALVAFETSVISNLKGKNAFSRVERDTGTTLPDGSLRVGMKISSMRIASFGARFWGGAFAGNSYMNVELELVDASTGKTLRAEMVSSSNNAWGAAWSFGSSDRSLPTDMGRIIAEYLYAVARGKKLGAAQP